MVSRLMLCAGGTVGTRIVSRLAKQPGSISVLTGDERRAETLREDGIAADHADPTDPSVVATRDGVETVIVVDDDPTLVGDALAAAEKGLPDARLVGYLGGTATPADRARITRLADETIDSGQVVADETISRAVGESSQRVRRLRRTLRTIDGELAVVMHDNPDPDAIGSAVALSAVAERLGIDSTPCYYGEITHQENRAFVNLLDIDLRQLAPDEGIEAFDGVALVDHSRPGVNDQLPPETPIDIVVDHHPPLEPVEARYVDLRSDVGATSTLMAGYVEGFGIDANATVASALLYGIRVDTDEFTREVSTMDFEAAAYLLTNANTDVLERVEDPSVTAETFDTIGRAIRNRELDGDALTSGVGRLQDRDAIAQAADQLLELDGVTTTLVYGLIDDVIHVSARARGAELDLGETLRDAFDRIGSAGGHSDMAGAQIPLGGLERTDESDASVEEIIRSLITTRFREALDARPVTGPADDGAIAVDEYSLAAFDELLADRSEENN